MQSARLRTLVASIVLGVEAGLARQVSAAVILAFAFTAYGVLIRLRGGARNRGFGLLCLFIDTGFLLVFMHLSADRSMWLVAVFYLYLIGSAVLQFGPVEVGLVFGGTAVVTLIAGPSRPASPLQAIVLCGCLGTAWAISRSRTAAGNARLSESAAAAHEEARTARDKERQRIAADFHDGPLQSFISFQIRLDVLRRVLERDLNAGLQELRAIIDLSQAQVAELRSFVRSMRPVEAGSNIVADVRRLADSFQKESGIPVTFVGDDKRASVAPEISRDLLQMVRETLHNVQKHANASRVGVAVEQAGKQLEISIDDNGVGFPFSGTYSLDELDLLRLGPVSLKRRARTIRAQLLLESRPGRGAGVKIRVPL